MAGLPMSLPHPGKDAAGLMICELLYGEGDGAPCRGRAGGACYGHCVVSRGGAGNGAARKGSLTPTARQQAAGESDKEHEQAEPPPPTAPPPRDAKEQCAS